MTNKSLLNKLKGFPSQAEEIFLLFRRAGEVSADDEFEMDYLVDAVDRNLKKLHTIVKRYEQSSTEFEPNQTAEKQHSRNTQVKSEITNNDGKDAKTDINFEDEGCDNFPVIKTVDAKAGPSNAFLGTKSSDGCATTLFGEIAADTDSDGTTDDKSEIYQNDLKPVSIYVV